MTIDEALAGHFIEMNPPEAECLMKDTCENAYILYMQTLKAWFSKVDIKDQAKVKQYWKAIGVNPEKPFNLDSN